jgi:MFS superfamily sulfate permease-like transporter
MEPVNALVTVTFISGVIALVIERLRARLPNLDGDLVNLVALALGTAVAWGYALDVSADVGLGGLAAPFNYLATGIVITFGAGFIGTLKNAQRAEDPKSEIHTE